MYTKRMQGCITGTMAKIKVQLILTKNTRCTSISSRMNQHVLTPCGTEMQGHKIAINSVPETTKFFHVNIKDYDPIYTVSKTSIVIQKCCSF
jgi:hypothetical protein